MRLQVAKYVGHCVHAWSWTSISSRAVFLYIRSGRHMLSLREKELFRLAMSMRALQVSQEIQTDISVDGAPQINSAAACGAQYALNCICRSHLIQCPRKMGAQQSPESLHRTTSDVDLLITAPDHSPLSQWNASFDELLGDHTPRHETRNNGGCGLEELVNSR